MYDDADNRKLTPDSAVSEKLMYAWGYFRRIDSLAVRGLPGAREKLAEFDRNTLTYDADRLYNMLIQHRKFYSSFLITVKDDKMRAGAKKKRLCDYIRMSDSLIDEMFELSETEIRMEFLHAVSYVVRNHAAMYMTFTFLYRNDDELIARYGQQCMAFSEKIPELFRHGCESYILPVCIYAAESLVRLERFDEAEQMRQQYLDGYDETRARILRTQPYTDTRMSMIESLSVIYYVLTSIRNPEETEERMKYYEKISGDKRLAVTKIVSRHI